MLMVLYYFFLFSFSFVYDAHMWGREERLCGVGEGQCLSTYGPQVDVGSHLHCSSSLFSEAGSVDQTQSAHPLKS